MKLTAVSDELRENLVENETEMMLQKNDLNKALEEYNSLKEQYN